VIFIGTKLLMLLIPNQIQEKAGAQRAARPLRSCFFPSILSLATKVGAQTLTDLIAGLPPELSTFHNHGDPLATTNTERCQAIASLLALHSVEQGNQDTCATGPNGMP
jgi:hypothetical protein